MKSILFLLCLVNALEVFAQQFLPFHKERPVYYQFTGDEVFYTQAAIFIDSFKLSGADTIFFITPLLITMIHMQLNAHSWLMTLLLWVSTV